ncbi:MAG: hypothetical protein M3P23_10850 [Actinomycetota bacterium]|nr:hypothetical protein [Actinomycetota bacterium]
MADYDEDALQAALAPGIAKAKALFDEVAKEMGSQSADDVHAELVKRLEAEPFEWADKGLREIASSISAGSTDSPDPEGEEVDNAPADDAGGG